MTMDSYTVVVALHVLVAVVGVGLLGAVPIAARVARREPQLASARDGLFGVLFTLTRASLATMLLTGAFLDYSAGGAFHTSGWFRASFVLLLVAAFAIVRARGTLRSAAVAKGGADAALRRVEQWGWAACTAVAVIAVLMEVKPFR
jgi:hypothetical protein